MRNNTRGLIFHLIIIAVMFIFTAIVNLSEMLKKVLYGNIAFRIILCIIPILLYYNLAKGMSKKKSKRLDFLSGNIIVLISVILFIPPFLILKSKMFSLGIAESIWKFPLDLFLMPELFIYQLLKIDYNIVSIIIASLIPGFIYGISIKKSRIKIMRKIRMKQLRSKRYEK
ncbi:MULTISPECIES: hypothetical protein [Peptoniphilus]|uniref:hypothetical protein n=1 Tax=Peptoniphilus TaxID=162289 RepID=UPI0001DA9B99|nr:MULTISPECIES: hypothetical protein [Peptoniphilus]EFI42156.1 hypothetical protein HMPREF0629_00796 [Peptoniphilus sp. oral taxon 386 str. F0131]